MSTKALLFGVKGVGVLLQPVGDVSVGGHFSTPYPLISRDTRYSVGCQTYTYVSLPILRATVASWSNSYGFSNNCII